MGAERDPRRPPLVLVDDRARLAAVGEELEADGWMVLDALELPHRVWHVGPLRVVCAGAVRRPADVTTALAAAARGAGVIVEVERNGPLRERLFEDLGRLGVVTIDHGEAGRPAPLAAEQRSLLELLAGGATLDEAARALGYSRRTVDRRLAAARVALGARTTTEALLGFRRAARHSRAGLE